MKPLPITTPSDSLIDRIDALLPQTQCRQCGYDGCYPYAEAIVRSEADINQCPPGGAAGVQKLADLLGRESKPLNPTHGIEKPRVLATIDEGVCIGCTLCIQACPVDAIIGAAKLMHTVVPELCTGCELCVPPCPVDCIDLLPIGVDLMIWHDSDVGRDASRQRYRIHQARVTQKQVERLAAKKENVLNQAPFVPTPPISKNEVLAAIARARAKKKQ